MRVMNFLTSVVLALVLVACGDVGEESTNPVPYWDEATTMCAPFGGMAVLHARTHRFNETNRDFVNIWVTCKDGTKLERRRKLS